MNVEKMTDYFENFILVAIKNSAHLEVFLKAEDTLKQSEKEFIRDLWEIETLGVPDEDEDGEEIVNMSKDELEDFALEYYDVDIDKRHNISTLIEQVIELKEQKED